MSFGSIDQAITDLRNGRLVVVADDEARENEGDLIGAAQLITPDLINFMTIHGRGLLCLALTPERCDQLDLPQQVDNNTDEHATAFTVTTTPRPASPISRIAASSWGPQSQRIEWKTSPVRHFECIRTRTSFAPATSPWTSATCSARPRSEEHTSELQS